MTKRWFLALLSVAVLAAACGGGGTSTTGSDDAASEDSSNTYSDNNVTFRYPEGWDELDAQANTETSGSNSLWTETVGPSETDLVSVTAYQLNLEVNEDNIADVESELNTVIQGIVDQAKGTIESGPDRVTVAGFPAYKYEWSGVVVNDEETSSEVYLVFNGKTEYFINCQYSDDSKDEVLAGCHTILDTFEA